MIKLSICLGKYSPDANDCASYCIAFCILDSKKILEMLTIVLISVLLAVFWILSVIKMLILFFQP